MPRRSPRGADFTSLTAEASFSPCARVAASSPRSAASDFSRASVRAAAAGSGTGLPALDLEPGDARGEAVDRWQLSCGAAGAEAGWIAGQPSIQPTPITSAAATAPETGATIQGETGGKPAQSAGDARGPSGDGSGCRLGRRFRAIASAALFVSLDTSVASRSMVGGARFGRP